ncbi:MAG: rhomboid family intramembrane serine protease [Chloroflexota bacterium]|nr:rhomboid family intramembrane serine protease [Chloroflexota bacterium]
MFPIGDEHNGRLLTPYVNYTLIAINIVVFLYQLLLPEPELLEFIFRWGAIPAEISQGQDLFGLVSSMFLHGGWLHIAGNMLFLWVFGDNVEDTMGHVSYLLFYLLTGLAAGLAQVVIDSGSQIPLVGASGAISGVLGAYIMLFPHGRIRTLVFLGFFITVVLIPAWVQIGLWIVLQFFNGFASLGVRTEEGGGVAYWAHIGGFIAGMGLVWLFRDKDAVDRQRAARAGNQSWQRVGLGQR